MTIALSSCRAGQDRPTPGPDVVRPAAAGAPRYARLGFGVVPSGNSPEAYVNAFATAARNADVVMIQRAPPWSEFLPGGRVSKATEDLTRLETALIKQYGLDLFFAIDPTDPAAQRSRLIDVPARIEAGLADPDLKGALSAYVAYIARNYRPRYLAVGVEVDMYADRQPKGFEAFVEAYRDAYRVAKAASPNTLVFPTFQLEDIEGNVGTTHPPRWDILPLFEGHMDALAVSTFPYLARLPSARALRADYYRQLGERFRGPVIIAAAGYTSVPIEGAPAPGTEEDQLAFVERLRDDAEAYSFELVVWVSPHDPPVVAGGTGGSFRGIGLLTADGNPKQAWRAWEEWSRRPLEGER